MKIGYLLQTGVPDMHSQPLSGPALHVKHIFEELQASRPSGPVARPFWTNGFGVRTICATMSQ